jgi:hypothetical protein
MTRDPAPIGRPLSGGGGPEQTGPEQTDGGSPAAADQSPADAPTERAAAPAARILPVQSREDTDAGWGDYRDPDDDDRLLRDCPPHWGNG